MAVFQFSLPEIHCAGCIGGVKSMLSDIESIHITDIHVDLITKILTVTVDGEPAPAVVQKLVVEALDGVQKCLPIEEEQPSEDRSWKAFFTSHTFLGGFGTSAGLALMVISMLGITFSLPLMILLSVASIGLTLFLGAESYREAYVNWKKTRKLTMDSLFSISTITILVVSISAFFIPWLPMMFETAILIYGLRHVGQAIEESIKQTMGFRALFKDRLPKNVNVIEESELKAKALTSVNIDEIILVNPGQIIPLDGVCETEEGSILETILTGSFIPRKIERKESVTAGMYVAEDSPPLRIRVTKPAAESYLVKLDKNIALYNAENEKAPLETITDKILQYFIPTILAVSVLTTIAVSFFFPFALALQCGVAVLVSACPCTLGFIIPLAVRIGMSKAAEHGVQFKNAKALQDAAKVNRVVLDLNGTLTKGVFKIRQHGVVADKGIHTQELLAIASAIEKESKHPIAKSICEFVKSNHITSSSSLEVTNVDKSNHSGIKAKVDGIEYTIGNANLMKDYGIDTSALQSIKQDDGDHLIYIAREKEVIGYVLLTDPLRANAEHTVTSLRELGIEVYIFTGSDETTAHRYGKLLHIDPEFIRAGCKPEQKSAAIKEFREAGHIVSMVGDASNDAFAISASNFGIAVQGGDAVTEDQAGAIIQRGSLLPVINTFVVAKETVAQIKQNLVMSLVYNLGAVGVSSGLLLGIGIIVNPAIGVALMFLQSTLILLNAYRYKNQPLKHLKEIAEPQEGVSNGSYQRLHANLPSKTARLDCTEELEDTTHCELYSKEPKLPLENPIGWCQTQCGLTLDTSNEISSRLH